MFLFVEVICFIKGNDVLFELTKACPTELRIELEDFDNVTKYAVYRNFSVGDRESGYRLTLGGYEGTAGTYVSFLCLII